VKLYIHCGYHKTGSSFLQTIFSQNRQFLIDNGIYFPVSADDKNMLGAKISRGNGIELVNFLNKKNEIEASRLFSNWLKETIINNCSSLLISSEGFFHTFSKEDSMKMFCDICEKSGIDGIDGLLLFRNPIKHVLSVYKHRAKYGKIQNFKNWASSNYETLEITEYFLDNYNKYDINWCFRKYSSDSNTLIEIAFKDWLNLSIPKISKEQRVNASLTLSEILALYEAKQFVPEFLLREISHSLSKLPNSEKAKDIRLNSHYSKIAYNSLKKNIDVIERVNHILPSHKKLEFEEVKNIEELNEEHIILSATQLRILLEHIKKTDSIKIKLIAFLKKQLKKIIRFKKEIFNQKKK